MTPLFGSLTPRASTQFNPYMMLLMIGVLDMSTPLVMWKIIVPPWLHILWLLVNNKTLTRDNLVKRMKVDDGSCLFCNEAEHVLWLLCS
jgi:hypothetical protein